MFILPCNTHSHHCIIGNDSISAMNVEQVAIPATQMSDRAKLESLVTECEVVSDTSTTCADAQKPTSRLTISPDYVVKEGPLGTIRPIRIICLGAGASGINLAYQVQQRLRKTQLVIYEKNPGVGGTWYENRYPGCKCDIRESH
jgi:hypothetical protein